jgi:NAD(P)H dehydrogenase (quinone)
VRKGLLKDLIIYDSKTGNPEKMAFMIAEGIGEADKVKCVVKKVEDATLEDLMEAHGIIMGSPIYYGCMSGKLKEFFGKSVADSWQTGWKDWSSFHFFWWDSQRS